MRARAEALAVQFEQANDLLAKTIAAPTVEQWAALCPAEGWSVGVTAHHIALDHQIVLGLVQMAAAGEALPTITVEEMNQGNEERARQHAGCSKAETLALLREANAAGVTVLRSLSDAQLQRVIALPGRDLTLDRVVTDLLIGHVEGEHGHLASMRAACAAAEGSASQP